MEKQRTVTSQLKLRTKDQVDWRAPVRRRRGEELMRNLAVASALVVSAIAIRGGALPSLTDDADAVLASVSEDMVLDDTLGRLSFVSSMFPEATLVFGRSEPAAMALPVSGGALLHAWSESEPYTSWRSAASAVTASADGTVMGVYHGAEDERIVEIRHEGGVTSVYGNLAVSSVAEGDAVSAGDVIGQLRPDGMCVFEAREDGRSVDPSPWLWGGA